MAADVYFTDMRAKNGESLLDKVEKLFDRAGFKNIIQPKDLVAVKLHFGESGNTAYIRPQFFRRLVKKVKECEGRPFLTDANTLYVGTRSNAVDHLRTAIENGFDYAVVDAPLIIADGLNGKDYVKVKINGKHFSEVNIASAVYHADSMLVVSHFKGHEASGFGGAIKNLGMGTGSRSGKQMMHSSVLPKVDADKCIGCTKCTHWCPADAITVNEKVARISEEKCIGCGECTVTCPAHAIAINWKTDPDDFQEKMVEYCIGAMANKKGKVGFITFVMNVTPDCDCCGWSDAPIVNDVGILASMDPVALDQACVDLVNKQKALPNTRLDGYHFDVDDKFGGVHPMIDWAVQLAYGAEIGLGTREYNLIKV
ncbi:DUF362 domain-containing protein [Thermincola ferriacetica]